MRSWVTAMDAFPKVDTEYLQRTRSGGLASLLGYGLMAVLMVAEVAQYVRPSTTQQHVVDTTLGSKVMLSIDISVSTECGKIFILLAEHTGNVRTIDSLLGLFDEDFDGMAGGKSRQWAEQMRQARGHTSSYKHAKGCRVRGSVLADKVGGRLMVMPIMSAMGPIGRAFMDMDDSINFSHYIHHLSFGAEYPGMHNPLDGTHQLALAGHEHFSYFLSIIPTQYSDSLLPRRSLLTNQYSLNGFKGKPGDAAANNPGLFFRYDYEPLAVVITRQRIPFLSFLIHLVGILGGIYTCSGMLHHLARWAWEAGGWAAGTQASRRKSSARFDAAWSPLPSPDRHLDVVKTSGLTNEEGRSLMA